MRVTASRGVQCSPASSLFSSLKRRTSSSKIAPIPWLSSPACRTDPSARVVPAEAVVERPAANAAGPLHQERCAALPYAAMNSFHFRTMYRFSSITEFQHSTAPMRSWNEPPSRTAPADSIICPNGLMMSPCAGLPSNQ